MAAPTVSTLTAPLDGATIDRDGGLVLFQWTESTIPDAIEPSFIASGATVYAPTIDEGVAPNTIAPSFIASGAQVFAPTVAEGSSGPTVYAADDFVGTNNALLEGRTPTWEGGAGVGGAWANTGTGDLKIWNNAAVWSADPASYPYQSTEPAGADQRIELTLETISTANFGIFIRFRYDLGGNGYYVYQSNAAWAVYRRTGGTQTLLTSGITDAAVLSEVNDYEIEVETTGASQVTIRIFKNGVQLGSDVVDNSATATQLGGTGQQYVGIWTDAGTTVGRHIQKYRVTSLV